MSFSCNVELVGGDTLLEQHKIVTMVATKNGIEVDRFCASVGDLVDTDFFNLRFDEKTAYLKLKSYLSQKHN